MDGDFRQTVHGASQGYRDLHNADPRPVGKPVVLLWCQRKGPPKILCVRARGYWRGQNLHHLQRVPWLALHAIGVAARCAGKILAVYTRVVALQATVLHAAQWAKLLRAGELVHSLE